MTLYVVYLLRSW